MGPKLEILPRPDVWGTRFEVPGSGVFVRGVNLRLVVTNTGPDTARDVKPLLQSLEHLKTPDGPAAEPAPKINAAMKWGGHNGGQGVNIHSKDRVFLDLIRVMDFDQVSDRQGNPLDAPSGHPGGKRIQVWREEFIPSGAAGFMPYEGAVRLRFGLHPKDEPPLWFEALVDCQGENLVPEIFFRPLPES